jgi:hypothetical protein
MDDREAKYLGHPPSCTCDDCTKKRLKRWKQERASKSGYKRKNMTKLLRGFSFKKLFLDLLVIVCLVVAVWTAYRLFYLHKLTPIFGSIVFIVDIIVLIWSIYVLRNRNYIAKKPGFFLVFFSVLAIFLVLAFAGVQPIAGYKDTVASTVKSTVQNISAHLSKSTAPNETKSTSTPTQTVTIDNWQIQLISSSWRGSTLNVKLKITNLGPRRNFGLASLFDPGPELAVIDSTNKRIDPWVPEPDLSKGELMTVPPYTKEYYPNESWSGSLKFEMSPYSGETILYIGRYSWTQTAPLFNLDSAPK